MQFLSSEHSDASSSRAECQCPFYTVVHKAQLHPSSFYFSKTLSLACVRISAGMRETAFYSAKVPEGGLYVAANEAYSYEVPGTPQ